METVKKKLWTAVFVLIAVTFVFNFIYQIVLFNYEANHTFGDPYMQNFFRHMRFGAILGIILCVIGIAGAIFMVYCVQKKKNVDKVMFGSFLIATVPLKSAINLLSIHNSFLDMYYFFNGSIPYAGSFLLVLVAIVSFAAVGLSILGAFLKKFKVRHVLTATGVIASVFLTIIYVPIIPVPRIGGDYSFYFNGGEIIMGLVHLAFAAVVTAMFASISSPNFEKKYRMSAQARGIKIPDDPTPAQSSSDHRVEKIKKVQAETGLGLVEAKRIVDNREAAVENAMKMYGMTREEAEDATGYNKPANPAEQFAGMGLGLNAQQTPQDTNQNAAANDFDKQTMQAARASTPTSIQSSGDEIANLKRDYLQGKITKEEFNERLAELRNK